MKKLVIILIIFFISLINLPKVANAQDSTYAMVITDEAYLYSDGGGTMVKYILPKSYFVLVTDTYGELARVISMQGFSDCPQVEGYVKLVDLKFVTDEPETPYLNLSLTAVSDEVLFSDSEVSKPKTVLTKNVTAKYYGEYYYNNQKYYYVYANGYVGYVRSSCFEEPVIAYHPEYIKFISPPVSEDSSTSDSISQSSENSTRTTGFDTNNIIVIALILICGLCVLYFIFKPEKINSKSIYKDDE